MLDKSPATLDVPGTGERISSPLTPFFKFCVPVIIVGIVCTAQAPRPLDLASFIVLGGLWAVALVFAWMNLRLKRVVAYPDHLFISGYLSGFSIGFDQID